MINQVNLLGHVGRDPESRDTTSGLSVCSFSLATSRRYKDSNGQPVDETEWHNVVAFGKTADFISQYVARGRLLFVTGRLHTSKYTDKNGVEKYRTDVIAEKVQAVGRGDDTQNGADHAQDFESKPRGQSRSVRSEYKKDSFKPTPAVENLDEDIPF